MLFKSPLVLIDMVDTLWNSMEAIPHFLLALTLILLLIQETFTVEWWCKLPDQSNTMFIDWRQGGSGNGNLHIGTGGYGGSLAGAVRFTGDGPTIVSTSVVDDNEWHHVAICRASGTTKMYIDGTEEGSATDTTSYDRQGLRIGNNSYSSGGNHLNGLIADLRLVRGTAVYTSNFTPPTETLTAITNTKLLLGHLPYHKGYAPHRACGS